MTEQKEMPINLYETTLTGIKIGDYVRIKFLDQKIYFICKQLPYAVVETPYLEYQPFGLGVFE